MNGMPTQAMLHMKPYFVPNSITSLRAKLIVQQRRLNFRVGLVQLGWVGKFSLVGFCPRLGGTDTSVAQILDTEETGTCFTIFKAGNNHSQNRLG